MTARLFVPTLGPTDWRRLLAKPEKHWKRGRSALELAVCWETARETKSGIPDDVASVFNSQADLSAPNLLAAFPELVVSLPGGGFGSHNDLWALVAVSGGIASLAVEAKAGEPLGELVEDWLRVEKADNRHSRLAGLQALLGIPNVDLTPIRYQILHRTASALIQAQRFRTSFAVLLVHSFSWERDEASWHDFQRFCRVMGAEPEQGRLVRAPVATALPLYVGWATSPPVGEGRLTLAI